MTVQIYTRATLAQLDWLAYPGGAYARDYLRPLIESGPEVFIANAHCEVQLLTVGDRLLPLVLASPAAARRNSYVCSPYGQYIAYGKREVEVEFPQNRLLQLASKPLLNMLGGFFLATGFERVVFCNNWLLSTNLYLGLSQAYLVAIRQALVRQFPDRGIVFRSVNDSLNAGFLNELLANGFEAVLSRQVYLMNPTQPDYARKKAFKIDVAFWGKNEQHYRWESPDTLPEADVRRVKQLYDDLYLRKYSRLNPQFTEAFIQNALATQTLRIQVLRHRATLVAVIGYYLRDGVMTNPFIGYDVTYPPAAALYRMLTLRAVREAERLGVVFNLSSGAAHFKRLRGAVASLEYNLVYLRHLPAYRRWPWRLLGWLSRRVLIPMMRRQGL